MILIADSGSTKTDWCIAQAGKEIRRITTAGTNPFFQSPEEISDELSHSLFPEIAGHAISNIYFYGAGIISQEKKDILSGIFGSQLSAPVEVNSDLMAAARSLCGTSPGIACILGTGSNSCLYNGIEITEQTSPLGFILGDEGSGAYLGKHLIADYLKGLLPKDVADVFSEKYGFTRDIILERVYRGTFPSRFLASLTPFLLENISNEAVFDMVYNGFTEFIKRNIIRYTNVGMYPLHFTGSVAHYFKEILKMAVLHQGLQMGIVSKTPMDGLIRYHTTFN